MRFFLVALLTLAATGCSIVYRLPTRQGNIIDQKQLDLLSPGQTREQVKYLLGTPIASSPFRNDRWEYLGYYKDPRGNVTTRTVNVFFDGDKLARVEGAQLVSKKQKALDTPEIENIVKEQQTNAQENQRDAADKQTSGGGGVKLPTP